MKIVLFAIALAMLGCGDDAQGTPVDAPVVVDATPDARVTTFNISGTVSEPVGSGSGSANPIANASLCFVDAPNAPCTLSDGGGAWSLAVNTPFVPTNVTEVTTADDHLGAVFLAGWVTDEIVTTSDVVLQTNAEATTLLQTQAGFTFPTTTTGFVRVFVGNGMPGLAAVGATAVLSPASGTGPVYLDDTSIPDPALTAVTSSGVALWGNLAPGVYEITVTATGKTCRANTFGNAAPVTAGFFAPTGGATVGIGIVAGALTSSVDVICN